LIISATQPPIRPNIPPDAPTEINCGRKIALIIVLPIEGTIKRITAIKIP
jgi:hypothetical protein